MLVWLVLLPGKCFRLNFLHPSACKRNLLIHIDSFAIGIVGDAGVRGSAQQPRLFVGMILILIFAEVLGISISFHDFNDYAELEIKVFTVLSSLFS